MSAGTSKAMEEVRSEKRHRGCELVRKEKKEELGNERHVEAALLRSETRNVVTKLITTLHVLLSQHDGSKGERPPYSFLSSASGLQKHRDLLRQASIIETTSNGRNSSGTKVIQFLNVPRSQWFRGY